MSNTPPVGAHERHVILARRRQEAAQVGRTLGILNGRVAGQHGQRPPWAACSSRVALQVVLNLHTCMDKLSP